MVSKDAYLHDAYLPRLPFTFVSQYSIHSASLSAMTCQSISNVFKSQALDTNQAYAALVNVCTCWNLVLIFASSVTTS